MSAIVRHRGDTWPVVADLTRSDGSARDLTGCTGLLLTVNRIATPSSSAGQVFESIGSILGDPLNGQAVFPVPVIDPNTYYYNIEMTDESGYVRTPLSGVYLVLQDITKSDVETIILLDSFGVDDTEIVADGLDSPWVTEFIISTNDPDDSRLIAGTRDDRRVVRWVHPIGFTKLDTVANLHLFGDAAPLVAFNPYLRNIEITLLGYIDGGGISLQLRRGQNTWIQGGVTQNQGGVGSSVSVASWISIPEMTYPSYQTIDSTAIPTDTAGWYWLKARFEKGLTSVKVRGWKYGEAEPASWTVSLVPDVIPSMNWSLLVSGTLRDPPLDGTEISEIAQISYRTWI